MRSKNKYLDFIARAGLSSPADAVDLLIEFVPNLMPEVDVDPAVAALTNLWQNSTIHSDTIVDILCFIIDQRSCSLTGPYFDVFLEEVLQGMGVPPLKESERPLKTLQSTYELDDEEDVICPFEHLQKEVLSWFNLNAVASIHCGQTIGEVEFNNSSNPDDVYTLRVFRSDDGNLCSQFLKRKRGITVGNSWPEIGLFLDKHYRLGVARITLRTTTDEQSTDQNNTVAHTEHQHN